MALTPYAWPQILTAFRSELALRSRLIAEFGVQAALSTLHPSISWNGTVMQIAARAELDIHPCGAGLRLMPSPLWTGRVLLAPEPDGSVLVVYPALTPLPLIDEPAGDPLADLVGHTRADVLKLTFTERSTSELARELGISAATVSGHTKTLRGVGLIVSTRAGKAVYHCLTRWATGCSTAPTARHGHDRRVPCLGARRPGAWRAGVVVQPNEDAGNVGTSQAKLHVGTERLFVRVGQLTY